MFQSPKKIATGTDFLSVADMNDDGIPDLITRSCEFLTFTGGILLGTENGGYQAPLCFESHGFPNQIVAADLNADQALDLVVTPKLSDDISVLLGNGDGSFRSHQRFGVGSFPLDYPVKTVVADINGDKLPDLVAANANSDDVSILIGRGDGSFYGQKRFAAGKNPVYFAVGDLNGDNLDDIVVANKGSGLTPGNVSVLLQH